MSVVLLSYSSKVKLCCEGTTDDGSGNKKIFPESIADGKPDDAITQEIECAVTDQSRSDLLQVIMAELLSTTFSKRTGAEEKLMRLQQMGIQVTEDIRERMDVMCNLSQGILREGIEQGLKQGMKQGMERGLQLSLDILDRRDEYPDETPEETARAVGCTVEDVQAVVNRRKRTLKR